jgi:TRAP-type uncharacterized transport system fused permease subunit
MDAFSRIQRGKHAETGAGLVEYSPLILFSTCILVSLFQVFVAQDRNYLWVIAVAFVLVISLIYYPVYKDRTKKVIKRDEQPNEPPLS